MTLDYRQLLKLGAVSALSYFLVTQVKELFRSINESFQIQDKEVINLSDIEPLLLSKQKSRLNIIKLKPYYFQPLHKQISIRSAQKIRFQPSDKDIANHFVKKLSYSVNNKTPLDRIPCQWFVFNQSDSKKPYRKIYGFGDIEGDFFDIKRQYEPIKKLSYWTRFRNWVQKQFLKILPQSNEVGTIKHRKPFFLGPVVGYLNYEVNLMRDITIIAVCNIENGKIIPTVTALSKSLIIKYFQRRVQKNYFKVAGLLLLTIIVGRWLWSDIKALLNTLKVKKQKLSSNYFNPQVGDDRVCIICYASCRNMLFFDCRHLIMCRECSQNYKSDSCPYCKLQIDEIKMVNGINLPAA